MCEQKSTLYRILSAYKILIVVFSIMLPTLNIQGQVRTDIVTYGRLKPVTTYENVNYDGQSKEYGIGKVTLTGNEKISSIKITQGYVVVLYEYADEVGGYGRSVDLLEDCADITKILGMEVAYMNIFSSENENKYIYVRNKIKDGQFVAGHWERKRSRGINPNTLEAIVSPPLPPNTAQIKTVLEINGPATIIKSLGEQQTGDAFYWESAINDQMGIIGNDYRGKEKIGSAAFQREFTGSIAGKVLDFFGASNINFWYPQSGKRDSRDHRDEYFKRTLAGKLTRLNLVEIDDILPDHDVNMFVEPSENYQHLITTAHAPELTKMTEIGLLKDGEPLECPDKFTSLEGEIDASGEAKKKLLELLEPRLNNTLCMYGIWLYDIGHCCHPEIHPAEQVWWTELKDRTKTHYLNVFCDASKRFWWRDQMDDGTKLRPWAAPPIKGLFAIAFEIDLGNESLTNFYKKYEVNNVDHFNVIEYPNADQTYELKYKGKTIISFVPNNNAFKVTFEKVGLAKGTTNKLRGFLVIETSVGTCTQVTTKIRNLSGPTIEIPENTDPESIPQIFERQVFNKVEGHYMFYITETNEKNSLPILD